MKGIVRKLKTGLYSSTTRFTVTITVSYAIFPAKSDIIIRYVYVPTDKPSTSIIIGELDTHLSEVIIMVESR